MAKLEEKSYYDKKIYRINSFRFSDKPINVVTVKG